MIEVTTTNKGYDLEFTLLDDDENVVNLTGCTVNFLARKVSDTYSLGGACTLVSPTLGTCKYTTLLTDFPSAGQYLGEITVTFPGGGKILSWEEFDIVAKAKQTVSP